LLSRRVAVTAPARYLAFAIVSLAMGASVGFIACGGGGTTSGGGTALIEVEISQIFMTVTNKAGRSLADVRVSIVPVGGATLFTARLGRMEHGEKRDLSLGQFQGRDGTPFDLRVVRPKAVRVSGTDLDGKTVEVEKSWR
jgi:hypothetical protein